VVDAAGTIYVIGGIGFNGIVFNDVWASTDGGARRSRFGDGRWGTGWVLRGYCLGTQGVLKGVLKG
jgi:hypothetical protein